MSGKAAEEFLTAGRPQVDRHGLATSALDCPVERIRALGPVDERTELAQGVAGSGLFDLDDLGSLLAQQACAEGGGDPGAEVEHPQARKGPPGHGLFLPVLGEDLAHRPLRLAGLEGTERRRRVVHPVVGHEVVVPGVALTHQVERLVDGDYIGPFCSIR